MHIQEIFRKLPTEELHLMGRPLHGLDGFIPAGATSIGSAYNIRTSSYLMDTSEFIITEIKPYYW